MAYVVRMPKLGVEMQTGMLIEWHADIGEAVEEDDVVAVIESAKSSADVPAREDGVLRETYLEPGEEVPPGTAMGIIAEEHEDISDLAADVDVSLEADDADASDADTDEPAAG